MSDIRRLRMLLELERRGTISAVADALAYSTSAVSQQLANLERDFGAPLLEPDGRRVRLTPQGEVLVAHAAAVVGEWERAQVAVTASLEEVSGTLEVAAFATACLAVVPDLIRTIRREHPRARVTVTQADAEFALSRVLSRDADLAITERFPGQALAISADIVETVLFEDRMLLAVPIDFQGPARGVRDLADCDWVVEAEGSPARDWAIAMCRAAGFEPRLAFESSDVIVQHGLVRAGLAVAFLPGLTPSRMLGGVRLIPLDEAQSRTVYALSRRSQHGLPLMRAVLEVLERGPAAG